MTRFLPHDYQMDAIRFVQSHSRCALWLPMGGGKTVSVLTALDELSVVEDVYPALVLAPLRVARSVWPAEVKKWAHLRHLRVSVITGSPEQRRAALVKPADIYVMNYENLTWLKDTMERIKRWPYKAIVADEVTRLKSFRLRQGSKRAQALARFAHLTPRFIGLTGTPAPNGLHDLWGPTWFLDKGAHLGHSFSAFERRWFTTDYNGYNLIPFGHSEAEIHERVHDICRTIEGLPVEEPIRNTIYVDLPADARRLYDELEEEMFAQIAEGQTITAVHGGALTVKCMQCANGAIYLDGDEKRYEEVHDEKLDALDSIIEEASGAPVLVAYKFRHDLERLLKAFPQARVLDAKESTIAAWNAGHIPALLAHPASAGHGLNLAQGGNILAFFGLDWSLEEHMQIIERIGPMRQAQAGLKRPVWVHYIVARNTVDGLILQRLEGKQTMQDVLLEAMKARGSTPKQLAAPSRP